MPGPTAGLTRRTPRRREWRTRATAPTPTPTRDWKACLESAPVASDAFMRDVEDLPVQERER